MYVPKYYEMKDFKQIKHFMIEHNFITIIITDNSVPIATHLPVIVEEHDNHLYVSGHFSKKNKQWISIKNNEDILMIFHGPHAYISSTWYETEDVPTWDYQSVHAYGCGELLDEETLITDLSKLLYKYEQHRDNGATWNNISDQTKQQIHGIVGFKVKIKKIEASYKLSQNRPEKDRENIIRHLSNSSNTMHKNLAKEIDTN